LGDAFIYLLCRYGVVPLDEEVSKPLKVLTNIQYGQEPDDSALVVKTNLRG
jgi:hypothetical protein